MPTNLDHLPDYQDLPEGRLEGLAKLEIAVPRLLKKTRREVSGIVNVWQPADYLPYQDSAKIADIQAQARQLPRELLIVLIGGTATEEGLPSYTADLQAMLAVSSQASGKNFRQGNLSRWLQMWAGEENRHGDLLKPALAFTGRVNMKAFEQTMEMLLEDGIDIGVNEDPYKGFIYTAVQEDATQRSHMNTAKLATHHGNPFIATISGQIAGDEGRHALAYKEFAGFLFEQDPNGMMSALHEMMDHGVLMPAHLMREVDRSGKVLQPGETFVQFAEIAQRIGVYTARDYAEIFGGLLCNWKIARKNADKWEALPMKGLNPEGTGAQRQVIEKMARIERLAGLKARKKTTASTHDFSWLVESNRKS